MKKRAIIFCFLVLFAAGLLPFFAGPVLAADTSTKLQYPIGNAESVSSPGEYLVNLYNVALGVAGVLAVGMIVAGGFLYMVGGVSQSQVGKARGMITGAILGLLLLIAAALILQTIDPNLLKLDITLPAGSSGETSSTTTTTANAPGAVTIPETPGLLPTNIDQKLDQQTAIARLGDQSNVSFNVCSGSSTSGCVGFEGVQASTVEGIRELAQGCPDCKLKLTSVTEGTHSTSGVESHANGYKSDFSAKDTASNTFFSSLPSAGTRSDGAPLYSYDTACCTVVVADERNLSNVPSHWDLKFSPKASAYKS